MFGNVLLIGGTSYLGAHIVYSFLTHNTGNIYVLIKGKDNIPVRYSLLQSLRFYFGDKFVSRMDKRIYALSGDVSSNMSFKLSKQDLEDINENVNVVINANSFSDDYMKNEKDVEVYDVENVIGFCKKFGKRLIHLSTTNVSGNLEKANSRNTLSENDTAVMTFNENNLYIGQNLSDIYTLRNFKSEINVLDAIYDGLDAQVLRIGNISGRFSDGIFKTDLESSIFARKLKSFAEIGALSKRMLDLNLDLTPVDLASDAIITILNHLSDCNMFHIMETNKLPVSLFSQTASSIGLDITPVSDRLMLDIINGILSDDERKDIVLDITKDLDSSKKLIYDSLVNLDCTFTEDFLKNCNFRFKKLGKDYIIKFLTYFKNIGFLKF